MMWYGLKIGVCVFPFLLLLLCLFLSYTTTKLESKTLLYTTLDDALRPYRVYQHTLSSYEHKEKEKKKDKEKEARDDILVYEEVCVFSFSLINQT